MPMFEWLSPWMINPALAACTGAVASPVLIHLLSRRRYRTVRWAAMEFLLEAWRRHHRRVRMEQLILLALRCLAMLLLALMVARPFFRPASLGPILGATGRTERVFLLDDSFSMAYRSAPGASVFGRARLAVGRLCRQLADESPGDSLTVLRLSDPRRAVLSAAALDDDTLVQLNERLEALAPSAAAADLPGAIAAVADLLRSGAAQAGSAVYLVTDLQRRDFPAPTSANGGIAEPLVKLSEAGRPVHLTLVDVGVEGAANVAVTSLRAGQPQLVAGVPARFDAAVSNFSSRPVEGIELGIELSDHNLPPVTLQRILPGQTVPTKLDVPFPRSGPDFLRVRLLGDPARHGGLGMDDSRLAAVEVVSALQVLVVDGEPSEDPYRDEVHLLKTALRPAGRVDSGIEVTVIHEHELEAVEWSRYAAVVIANVPRLGAAALHGLEEFARGGGGVIVFGGDQVDAAHYNEHLFRDGVGLLPVTLGDVSQASAAAEPASIADWDTTHPVLRPFTEQLAAVLAQVRINAFLRVVLPVGPASAPATAPSTPEGRPAMSPVVILARLNDADRSPIILTRGFGRGVVFFVTTSADLEWNDWAANFSFMPLMQELVQSAARPMEAAGHAVVHAPLVCRVEADAVRPAGIVRPPSYPVEPPLPVAARPQSPTESAFVVERPDKPGLWQFELRTRDDRPVLRNAAVNPDPTESDLARATPIELERAMGRMKFEYLRDLSLPAADAAALRHEWWWPLLIAAMVVLMAEHAMARWFGGRG
jgi:hypothetical protein